MEILKKTSTVAILVIILIVIAIIGFWGSNKSVYDAAGKESQIKSSGLKAVDAKFTQTV
jgi:hypothetical protein